MITGGKVTFEDAVKHDGYNEPQYAPSRRAAAEFAFSVNEGEDVQAAIDDAFNHAVAGVNERLGKKEVVVKPGRKKKDEPAKPEAVVDTSPADSDKAKLEAAAGLMTTVVPETPTKAVVVEEDSLDDLLGAQAPVPITDAELAKAAQTKNAQMKVHDPNFSVKIRALVVEYAGQPPKKITDVPVAKRQEFLDKLKDLK